MFRMDELLGTVEQILATSTMDPEFEAAWRAHIERYLF